MKEKLLFIILIICSSFLLFGCESKKSFADIKNEITVAIAVTERFDMIDEEDLSYDLFADLIANSGTLNSTQLNDLSVANKLLGDIIDFEESIRKIKNDLTDVKVSLDMLLDQMTQEQIVLDESTYKQIRDYLKEVEHIVVDLDETVSHVQNQMATLRGKYDADNLTAILECYHLVISELTIRYEKSNRLLMICKEMRKVFSAEIN